jgi:hypothetical protein
MKNRMPLGNAVISAAIVLSGNNYAKIAQLFRIAGLTFISSSAFLRIQRHAVCPAVQQYWDTMKAKVISKKSTPLIIAGREFSMCFTVIMLHKK